MEEKIKEESYYNFKGLFKYISTVVSWTTFTLLVIIGILLLYYFISIRLYATKGEGFEPKFSIYTIVSQSMEPTISVYDVIINTKIDTIDDVKMNDVITFISTSDITYGMTVTHRVVGTKKLDTGETCLITRGDNNTQEDQACVTKNNVIGVTKAVIPALGKVQFFLSSSFGWLLLIIVPAGYIIIKDILKIFGLQKEIKLEEEEKRKAAANKNNKNGKKKKLEQAYKDLKKVKKK